MTKSFGMEAIACVRIKINGQVVHLKLKDWCSSAGKEVKYALELRIYPQDGERFWWLGRSRQRLHIGARNMQSKYMRDMHSNK